MHRTFRNPATGAVEVIDEAYGEAMDLFRSLKEALVAETALEAAQAAVPSYLGDSTALDHTGPAEKRFHGAVDALYDAFCKIADERADRRIDRRQEG